MKTLACPTPVRSPSPLVAQVGAHIAIDQKSIPNGRQPTGMPTRPTRSLRPAPPRADRPLPAGPETSGDLPRAGTRRGLERPAGAGIRGAGLSEQLGRRYLECGILSYGFARARCLACGHGYCARPPFALERIEQVNEDRIVYRLPQPQRDGRTVLSLTPLELIDHLAAAPGDPRPWRRPALFPTRRSPQAKGHRTFARGSPQRTVARRRHRLRARCGSRRRAASGQSPCLPRRRSHQAPPLSALSVGPAHRPSVPHPATRLPRLRRRHAHPCLHHRDRSRAADPQQHRRARRPAADSRDGGGRAASGTAAEDQPGPPRRYAFLLPLGTSPNRPWLGRSLLHRSSPARLGRPAGRCTTRLGGPGATLTRVCLRPGSAVVAAFPSVVGTRR